MDCVCWRPDSRGVGVGESGSSRGARVILGTLAHHADRRTDGSVSTTTQTPGVSQLIPPLGLTATGVSYKSRPAVVSAVSGYDRSEVPLYEDRAAVERAYEAAQREGEPFFGVEVYEEGNAVTYDLLPTGSQLAPTAASEVRERLTQEIEAIVGDDRLPTREVSKTVGPSLANVSFFQREESARRAAAVVSVIVLDEANWVAASPPDGATDNRLN